MKQDHPKTILLVASFPESILSFRGDLIDALLKQGVVVHVAAPGLAGSSELREEIEERGAEVHDIPLRRAGLNPASDLRSMLALLFLMRSIRPTLVLAYTIKPVIYGILAARFARVPYRFALVTGLGYAFTEDRKGIITSLARRLYAFALSRASKVFFQNADDLQLFRDQSILRSSTQSLVVNGSGVNLTEFGVRLLPSGPVQFLMIGRLLGDKGVREFFRAAQEIRTVHPEAEFRLAGWIDESPDSISQVELDELTQAGDVEFLGRLDDVRPAIEKTTVYVLPSYREGTPRTVLEAMAMGRPIITTDAPGCRDTVLEGENGFLVPVQSVRGLVSAMKRFIDDPELASRMGERSREIAEEKYDVHKVNAVMLREMGIT